MRKRLALMIAPTQLCLTLLLAVAWIWAATWQNAAIEDMSDQLVIDGIISQEHAAKLRARNGSIGAYLQQGWDRRAWIAGGALVVTSLLGAGGAIVLRGGGTTRAKA